MILLYTLYMREAMKKLFKKLEKKDKMQLVAINKKLEQILENPYQFKPLKKPMQCLRRVHTMGHLY